MILRHSRVNYIAYRTLTKFAAPGRSPVVPYRGLLHRRPLLPIHDDLFHVALRFSSTDRSKVDMQLRMLKEELKAQEEENKRLKLVPRKEEQQVKLTVKQKIIHELKHYYHGFRLLALETKLSAKYLWRIMRGNSLTRRERQQMVRTVSDLFRLVPFSIFIIVPFMELALPIFIKLFPNMLPSTFQESDKEEEKVRKQVKVKIEMAKFLQDTLEEIALEKSKKNKTESTSRALEFARFMKKAREEGGYVSTKDLIKFSKLFEDQLTLDNLSMAQLRALCRLINVPAFGSPEILRLQMHLKLRELKADDKQIAAEGGVDMLTTIDLQQACRARGMRAIGVSEQRLKEQLSQWLELSLSDRVPPSLLLLSRALYLSEDVPFTDRLKSLVSQLPEGIAETTRQKLTEMEGGSMDYQARATLIKKIEEAIAQEKAMVKEVEKKKKAEEDAKKAKKEAELLSAAGMIEASEASKTAAIAAATAAEAAAAVQEHAKKMESLVASAAELVKDESVAVAKEVKKEKEKEEEAKKEIALEKKDLSTIEDLLLGGPLDEAKHTITELKEKVSEHTEDLNEVNALDATFAESKVAKRLRSKVESMIQNVDSLVTKLEEKKQLIDETIADPAVEGAVSLKKDKQVRVADVIDRLKKVKKEYAEAESSKLEALIKAMDEDTDGIIDSDVVLEVIGILEKHSEVSISPAQLASMIEVLKKEDRAEALSAAMGEGEMTQPITVHSALETTNDIPMPEVDEKLTLAQQQQQKQNGSQAQKQG